MKVLLQFDKSINTALSNRVKSRITFKASKLNTYRFCDNVWTLMLNDVEFREVMEFAKADRVKIVACDGKSMCWTGAHGRVLVLVYVDFYLFFFFCYFSAVGLDMWRRRRWSLIALGLSCVANYFFIISGELGKGCFVRLWPCDYG